MALIRRVFCFALAACGAALVHSNPQVPATLDYQTYQSQIEPIFLKQREGRARCYDCHSTLPTRFRLERLSQGATSWTDEQSRRNFAVVVQLVVPAQPLKSCLLLNPLPQKSTLFPYTTHTTP